MHNLEVQTNRAADPKICQGYDSVFIHPESKQSTDINSQGTTDTTHVNFIIMGKNVIRSRYAMDCHYQFNLSNMYNCEKHKNTVSIIGNKLS